MCRLQFESRALSHFRSFDVTEHKYLVATVACDYVLSVFTCSPHASTLKQRLIRCGSW